MSDCSRAVTFDLEDTRIQADPYPFYPLLREQAPVLKSHIGGQASWVVSRRKDISAILMDPATYSSRTTPLPNVLFADAPHHAYLRRMVAARFTRPAVQSMAEDIQAEAEALFGRCLGAGRFDVVGDFGGPLTINMISKLLGIPVDQVESIRDRSRHFADYVFAVRVDQKPQPQAQTAIDDLSAMMLRIATGRFYAEQGMMAILADQHRAGNLTDDELVHFAILLFVAGHSTTTNLIGGTVYMLSQRPQDLDRLRTDADFVASFIEEVLRTRPSFHRILRVTTRDVELHGVKIPAGSSIRLLLASANRDPEFFPDGETFDPDRKGRMHSTFGQGNHTCLGAWLARLEATTALSIIARRAGKICLDPERPPVPLMGGTLNEFGFEALPVIVASL
jgi:cytochrome P450